MSFFDQPYYALNKFHMCQLGIWPEQSKYVRNIWPMMIFALLLSMVGPQLIRLREVWGNVDAVINYIPPFLCLIINFTTVVNSMVKTDKMKIMLQKIEAHWKMFKNTSAVIILDKYAERGRYLTTIYTLYIYTILAFYLAMPILPAILDYVDPLNETRPKEYIYEAEYGVDPDKYYWYIIAHGYLVTTVSIAIFVAIDTIYIMWVEHACALFEVVGFNLKLATGKYMSSKNNAVNIHNDLNYKKICDCIIVHKEAISFAGMIEKNYLGSFVVVIGTTMLLISVCGIQAMINVGHPEVLLQFVSFAFGVIFHLYVNSIPGQKLIDHSLKIHTFAYDLDWYDMSVKAQKLLTLILMRSNKPCLLTAGKVYVLSMENFGWCMRTALSYFMVFARLL